MTPLLLAGALLSAAAILGVRTPRRFVGGGLDVAAAAALAACALAAATAVWVLAAGTEAAVRVPWPAPGAALALHLDALAALFLLPVALLGGLGIIYGRAYWVLPDGSQPRTAWGWYYGFVLSMGAVTLAANAVLFLVAWESMSVTAYFLVTHEHERPEVRQAGWMFLVAAHLGTAFLLVMFAVLGRGAETLDFTQLRGAESTTAAGVVLVLALIGFGTKAGLVPAHIWLTAAHPISPSHVSALMSGAMIELGVYGLLRVLTLLPVLPGWAGWLLLALGLVSGLYGVLMALAQNDLKRVLAFSSVENVGIITVGIGTGLLGLHYDAPGLAVLGFAGGLLHVLNHALFKGLLFLGSGAVLHATHTRDLDHMGGLLRRMPWTGLTFGVGALAISGLPPFNGFVSEFLIYMAAIEGGVEADGGLAVAMLLALGGLALIGGLAAATFAKAFGIAFLGTARTPAAAEAVEPAAAMLGPLIVLALACVLVGLWPGAALALVQHAAMQLGGGAGVEASRALAGASHALARVALVSGVVIGLAGGLAAWRGRLLAGRRTPAATWGTGYLAPTARMQYSSASFAAPLTTLFGQVLRIQRDIVPVRGYFPRSAAYRTRARGLFREPLFEPFFRSVARAATRLRWLQHGRIQLYLLNLAATLVLLMLWKLGLA